MVEISQKQLDELLANQAKMQLRIEQLERKEKMTDVEYEYAQYQRDKAVRMTEIQKFHRILAKQKQEGVPKVKRIGWNSAKMTDEQGGS